MFLGFHKKYVRYVFTNFLFLKSKSSETKFVLGFCRTSIKTDFFETNYLKTQNDSLFDIFLRN